jgi:small subunit ribosomal protein S8
MVNDTISDLLTKIRNATGAKHQLLEVPLTKITKSIIEILKEEGFLENYKIINKLDKTIIIISLKYYGKNRQSVITNINRVSRPGLRLYANKKNIPTILSKLGIAIISTSKGLMTDSQAKNLNLGGEILCKIY